MPDTRSVAVLPHRSIEDFQGDFNELASLMHRSWAENQSQPLLYSSEFLSSSFTYPGANFHLAPAVYEDSKLVAFIAGLPRRVQWKGKLLRVIVGTFNTVASEHKRRGYGVILWSELVKRARAAGFDGMMNYCVDGEPMNSMILGCCRRMAVPAAEIFSVHYLVRLLQPRQANPGMDEASPKFVDDFLRAASRMSGRLPLARIWSREEAEWQCERRLNPVVASYTVGQRLGLLTGHIMHIDNRDRTKCLLIEDVFWGDLVAEERRALVEMLVKRAAVLGARMASVPVVGYADSEPFTKSRFLKSPRVLHAYLSLWNGGLEPQPVSSFYLDVF